MHNDLASRIDESLSPVHRKRQTIERNWHLDPRGRDKLSSPLLISIIFDHSCLSHTADWFILQCKTESQHAAECPPTLLFHSLCHPPPLCVLNRPWQCSQSQSRRDTIVAECVRMSLPRLACWAEMVCVCVCVSGPGVGFLLETGSWRGSYVDVGGRRSYTRFYCSRRLTQ